MKLRSLFTLFVIITFCKCQSEADPILTITIDPEQGSLVPLSEITEKLDVVELETNNSSLINDITMVDTLNNHYLIADYENGILVFDKAGKFIRKIGKIGRGPGEVAHFMSFRIDRADNLIHLNSLSGPAYDINGNFINKKSDHISNSGLSHISSNYRFNNVIYSLNHNFKGEDGLFLQDTYFVIQDLNTGVADSIFMYRHQTAYFSMNFNTNFVFQNGGQVYLFYSKNTQDVRDFDTLFFVNKYSLEPFVRIKLIKQGYMQNQNPSITNTPSGGRVENLGSDIPNILSKMFMSERYLFIAHGYRIFTSNMMKLLPEDLSYFYYDLKTKKGANSLHGFVDDIYHSGDSVNINFMGGDMFYFTRERGYSEQLKTELNPTLYVGVFKE